MSVLILGDVHIGKGVGIGKPAVGSDLNSRIQDQLGLLEWVLGQAVDNRVTDIVVTGDVYEDIKPHPALIVYFMIWVNKCMSAGIHVHIVAGNHDIMRTGAFVTSALDLIPAINLSKATVYKKPDTVKIGKTYVTMMPFRDRRMLRCDSNVAAMKILESEIMEQERSIPTRSPKVLIGHLAIEKSIYVGDEFDDLANELLCPLEMFSGYTCTWMGHVHRPQQMGEDPYVAHVGSMDISDFGETDHQKTIVIFDDQNPASFKHINVPNRPLRKVVVEVPPKKQTTQYVIDIIKHMNKGKAFTDAIVRVEIRLEGKELPNVDRAAVENAIYDLGAFYVCGYSESRNISVIPIKNRGDVVDNTMDTSTAIRAYAEKLDIDEKAKSRFIHLANDVVKRHEEGAK